MKKIIAELKRQIRCCKLQKEDLNDASFGLETGVLISANEAQKIVNALEERRQSLKK